MNMDAVNPGDVFVKNDKMLSKWKVEKVLTVYTPTHVRLNEMDAGARSMTVALSALLDTRLWIPFIVEE